jgi:hypothetical protein
MHAYDVGTPSASEESYSAFARHAALQDIFSLGCVIAELFLENRPLFDLSKVLHSF